MPKTKAEALRALTPRGMQLVSFVVNAAALGSHSSDCDLESMAAKLETTPGRLRPMLRKLEAQGWLTIEGVAEYVYPTVAAIRRSPAINVTFLFFNLTENVLSGRAPPGAELRSRSPFYRDSLN